MPHAIRHAKLDTRNARLKLKVRPDPYWCPIITNVLSLGYRRGPGTWTLRLYTPNAEQRYLYQPLGSADDHADATGDDVLSFTQAQDKARKWYDQRAKPSEANAPSVAEAIDTYKSDLKRRGGETNNADRLRGHLPAEWLPRKITSLTTGEFIRWHTGLPETVTPATANRIATCLRAALNRAAKDAKISERPWSAGLAAIANAQRARNIILNDYRVKLVTAEAYVPRVASYDPEDDDARRKAEADAEAWARAFGLLVEVLAQTGARYSQVAKLEVRDLMTGAEPRLLIPVSKKGHGEKQMTHRQVPIPALLAFALRAAAGNRPGHTRLLLKPTGKPWGKSDQSRPFETIVERLREREEHEARERGGDAETIATAGAAWDGVTINALRHSSIVRQLKANIPTRIVAATHDTSVAMIERNYSVYITDHAQDLTRAALLDLSTPSASVSRLKTG